MRTWVAEFTYGSVVNGSSALKGLGGIKPNPRLYLTIFDPSYSLKEAFESGYAPLSLINANGVNSINLNLNTIHRKHGAPMYFYSRCTTTLLLVLPLTSLTREPRSLHLHDTRSWNGLRC